MKRILSLALIVILAFSCLAGCGAEKNRILFKSGLSKYVKLGEFDGIEVDTKGDDYAAAYQSILEADFESLGTYVRTTEGTVADGDTVNITFVGKQNGVAFEGGSGTSDLTIGSGQFIDGFEEGLIGVDVGETVDLNLTFPDPYENNPDLAGAAVVFTVTVNNIMTDEEISEEDAYKELGFASQEEYMLNTRERAIKEVLFSALSDGSEIKDYPQEDLDLLLDEAKKSMGVTTDEEFEQMLEMYSMTKDDFMEQSIKPMAKQMMLFYAVADEADITVTSNEINEEATEIAEEIGEGYTADQVKETYGEYYIEYYVMSEKVLTYMYENATIK